jgi:hypothetical protein
MNSLLVTSEHEDIKKEHAELNTFISLLTNVSIDRSIFRLNRG